MMIETSRFGSISVSNEEILSFPEGMLGFSKIHQYVLLERADDPLFVWLQALKKPNVAFPLLEPEIFEKQYKIELEEEDQKILEIDSAEPMKVFAIITIPTDPTKMTANLLAPIVMNLKKRVARQVILHATDYPIRRAIYNELQQFCVSAQRPLFPDAEAPVYQAIRINEDFERLSSANG